MNLKNIFSSSRKSALAGFLIILLTILLDGNLFAQEELHVQQANWYINTNLHLAGGNFIYNSFDNVISLYGGVGYQSGNFGISFSIPVVGNKSNFISQSGGMMLPIGNSKNGYGNMQNSGSNGSGMMGSGNSMMGSSSSAVGGINWGLGDLYLYSNYQLVSQNDFFTDVIVNANVKFPTASTHMGIGTGQYDYGASLTFRKSFDLSDNLNSFVAIADLGYINFGDPPGITYENPFTYSFGLGKFFNDGEYSLLLYYSAYTEVVKGYDPPRQIALGLNYKVSDNLILTGIGAAGLSKFSPAYNFSAGVKVGI